MAVLNKRAIVTAIEMYGVTAIRLGRTLNPSLDALIKALFTSGVQGFAYDPNDLTTLYQDAAGTIPVTAAGQPVGLMKDKSGRNNHAFQTVSASRPILQQTPILGNELIQDTEFNASAYWDGSPTVVNVSGGFANFVGATTGNYIRRANSISLGKTYQLTFTISAISGGSIRPSISLGTGSLAVGDFNKAGTYTVNAVASGTQPNIQLTAIGTTNATVDNISVKEVTGYRTDQNYLAFDGVDDFLQTNNIDFTATDKVSLFAGVRKLSDAATGLIAEISTQSGTTNGSFGLLAPASSGTIKFQFISNGAVGRFPSTTDAKYSAPYSAVVRGIGNISEDVAKLLINSELAGQALDDQGTRNFGNFPLYIGRRAGTSLPFNGHLYSLIGIGKLTTDDETTAIEKELAKRVGVTLNV